MTVDIGALLGDEAESLLEHTCKSIPRDDLTLPGSGHLDAVMRDSDRPVAVVRNMAQVFNTGRLAGTGYLSILPVDQGIEHSAAASFAKYPAYMDPARLCELAIEGGCSAFATTLGTLGVVARRYAHKIPFLLKLNHNELLTYPGRADQTMFATARQAFELGAVAVGATVY
ncbi:MAG: class I fructose-bisphosphate aldolase, partial [Acidimicrobiales bacterium]